MKRDARWLSAATFLCCCGGTDPGNGTQTLFANVEIRGRPDSTKLTVELRSRGNPVIGANVVVTDVEMDRSINLAGKGGGKDKDKHDYQGMFEGYVRTVRVRVTSGDDNLEAQLRGPSPHTIRRPGNDDIVRRADSDFLTVAWESDDPADRVTISADGIDPIVEEGDPFEVDVPLGALKDGDQKVEVERETSVDLAGGTKGSVMRSRYKVDNRFTLEG